MDDNLSHERFARLFAANQGRIYAYIMSLVFDSSTTEELFQETCVVLWQKFDQFEPGTDFGRWAIRIARLNVLKWREQQARRREYCNDEFIRSVTQMQQDLSEDLDGQRRALATCMQRLRPQDRDLLRQRYEGNRTAKQLARELGRTATAIYRSLYRIRQSLFNCIRYRLAEEEQRS